MRVPVCFIVAASAAVSSVAVTAAEPFAFQPTDKVVLIGGTVIEREQRYGYWETFLTLRSPGIKFRNLGWSGDNVFGESRRAFDLGSPDIGRKRLVDLTVAEKPTVIWVCYGAAEAFEGAAGLDRFVAGYEKLLDDLAATKARFILMSPPPLEPRARPLPDVSLQNERLAFYREAIRKIAAKRHHYFADLFTAMGSGKAPPAGLTDDGLSLSGDGYRRATTSVAESLGLPTEGATQPPEPIRSAVVAKNELYFHRWRPQNETYLFGFRKHEQGRNAKEVAEFDPLVAAAEANIAGLLRK